MNLRIVKRIIKEGLSMIVLELKHNASMNTDKSISKMQYTLLRENHVIEKGMSMRNSRKGFGQEKVASLLDRLNLYFDRYFEQDSYFLKYPLATIKTYIVYTKRNGVNVDEIERNYNDLVSKTKFNDIEINAGIVSISKAEIQENCNNDFESLLKNRHSIRYFTDEIPNENILDKALTLAQQTPSACNRQGWKTHVFVGNESFSLIKWQGGANGFAEEIHCAILVTTNLNAFLSYEYNQCYIDGGLYAMNLINSLHSLGLGTIPLSCGFYHNKLSRLKDFGIPENEVPIIIIGVGCLLDNFHVAVSCRKSISITNTYHK